MWPRNLYSTIALIHDLIMAAGSLWLAHYLRLGGRLWAYSGEFLPLYTVAFIPLCLAVFVGAGLYRGLWRYASMQDLLTLTKAATLALLIFYITLFVTVRLEGIPRSVPVIHWLLLIAMLGAPRFAYRLIKDRRLGLDFTLAGLPKVPVLLIGANDAAELFIRESRRNPRAPYHVVGLIDDNAARRGQQVHGVRIYGGSDQITKIAGKLEKKGRKPQRVVLSETNLGGKRIREILSECKNLGLPLSRLPLTLELKSGNAEQTEVKPIEIEDLLCRAQNVQDLKPVQKLVYGKRVLVTGAGGTIGGELTRQIAGFAPASIILLEHAEFQLYTIERELADKPHDYAIIPVLGDVRDAALLDKIFSEHQPEIIFHAAALKHVPLAEVNICEALSVNVLGTRAVAQAALKYQAESMVLISTDKAVHPTSVMGASKRLAELYIQAIGKNAKLRRQTSGHQTNLSTVRFGNVLGSTGSVVPRFQQQLAAGEPLTVTHPEMTRYFMTVREAVELVLQSAALGVMLPEENGGIFVLEMGEPVKIDDLARQMIQLSGLPPEKTEIRYTGLRAGEKMHEELFYAEEPVLATPHHSVRLAGCDARMRGLELEMIEKKLEELEGFCRKHQENQVLEVLQSFVKIVKPTFSVSV